MLRFGRPHRHYKVTDSTNERARELAVAGAPSGTVVTAAEQTAGRGRADRRWSAPVGEALLYSAIVRPLGPEYTLLPLAVPLAVCEAVEALAPVRCALKWPNDVWIDERKVAGVLIDARPPEWAVIGIGLNVAIEAAAFPEDLRWPATSVGHAVTVEAARAALDERLSAWAGAEAVRVLAAFRERDALAGREVRWTGAGSDGGGAGTAAGVDSAGNLVVRVAGGATTSLGSGEVQLRIDRR